MNYTELIISFGDTHKTTLNSFTQEGLVIKETVDMITIKFTGEDPAFYVNQLERFRNRGVVITAKRDNDPRRNLRGALTSLDNDGAIILLGKYPVGLDIDASQQSTETPAEASDYDNSLVSQLLAKLDEQQKVIASYEAKNQPMAEAITGFEQTVTEVNDRNLPQFSISDEAVKLTTAEVKEQAEVKPESTTTKKKKA
jgi:hypothetical protein